MVKSPENAPAYSALLAELVPKYLDQSLYRVVNGSVAETTKVSYSFSQNGSIDRFTTLSQLLELKWDHSKFDIQSFLMITEPLFLSFVYR